MNECKKHANDFLSDCHATIKSMYVGASVNELLGDGEKYDTYMVYIKTPRGGMIVKFCDSLYDTEENNNRVNAGKNRIKPSAYDVLSCLQKYEVGDIGDFMDEFGYEIKSGKDLKNFISLYDTCVKEYEDVRRCFADEQIEKLREIR